MIEAILLLLLGLAIFYFTVWILILLPAKMAEARGRSAVRWVLACVVFSPFFAIFQLWWLGDHPDREYHENNE